jgi:hypothetical protein
MGQHDQNLLNMISSEKDEILADYNIQSPIVIKNLLEGHLILENNVFHQNIGMYGGAVYMHNTEDQEILVYFKNNTYTKNMAYFAGNAVYVSGCPWMDLENEVYQNNYGKATGVGSALHIDNINNYKDSVNSSSFYAFNFMKPINTMTNQIIIRNSKFIENFGGVQGSGINIQRVQNV